MGEKDDILGNIARLGDRAVQIAELSPTAFAFLKFTPPDDQQIKDEDCGMSIAARI